LHLVAVTAQHCQPVHRCLACTGMAVHIAHVPLDGFVEEERPLLSDVQLGSTVLPDRLFATRHIHYRLL
jgi:hypothetical protein